MKMSGTQLIYGPLVAFSLALGSVPASADNVSDSVNNARSNARSYNLKIPSEVMTGARQAEAAHTSVNAVNSPEFQERVQKESDRIQREVLGTAPKSYYPGATKPALSSHLDPGERIYIFVSSSMPEATLRAYARDMDTLGDKNVAMVMRGFVGGAGAFKPTMKFISRILYRDPDCSDVSGCPAFNVAVEIDPNLYRRYKPLQVPAVVYAKGINPNDPDMSEGLASNLSESKSSTWLLLYGDASLGYLLSKAAESAPSPGLAALAGKLQSGGNHVE
jgi:type-F conjugative transfer system pilin assembly protein TrbC